jgi:hypothetical protein
LRVDFRAIDVTTMILENNLDGNALVVVMMMMMMMMMMMTTSVVVAE